MKKRSDDWDQLKTEIAKELGLWDKVAADGWSGLSSQESGKLGGVFGRRRKALLADAEDAEADEADTGKVE